MNILGDSDNSDNYNDIVNSRCCIHCHWPAALRSTPVAEEESRLHG